MAQGRVSVNGQLASEPGTKADLERDDIRVDGVRVKAPKGPVYLVLNKPRGVVTTRRDPAGRPTVMDLVPPVPGLFPVGRLDVTTEGLIVLTNDGVFAERVSHPRYEVPRVYHAKVHGVPDGHVLERLRRGVSVEGDLLTVDDVRLLDAENNSWVEVTLHEGRKHEVKRILEAVGHPVSKLRRVAFGPVTTKGLEPGQYRELLPEEVAGLLRAQTGRRPALAIGRKPKVRRPSQARPSPTPDRRGGNRPPFRRDDAGLDARDERTGQGRYGRGFGRQEGEASARGRGQDGRRRTAGRGQERGVGGRETGRGRTAEERDGRGFERRSQAARSTGRQQRPTERRSGADQGSHRRGGQGGGRGRTGRGTGRGGRR